MANFNEHSLEMSIMELFQDEGYIYLNGEQIHRERSEVLLIDDLRKYLLNRYTAEGLTASEVDSIILRLRSISGTIYEANKAVCKMADYIVLANQKYVPKVTEIYGVDPSRVLFVDMWRRFPEYTEPRFTKRALFFGRMNPYKGVDNLLEIVKLCPDVQFDAVGRVDPLVQELVDQLKTLPNVTMNNGYVSDDEMAEAFINADWVILPYNSATQSGVVIDGYRYGRPCIAFNVGAITEQVSEGASGFLIEPGNNEAFAKKLKDVVAMDEKTYAALSKTTYDYGSQKYAADGAVDRFIELIS